MIWWFVIGAALGVTHALAGLARGSIEIRRPARGMLLSGLLGAMIYGTTLWVVFGVLLGIQLDLEEAFASTGSFGGIGLWL